jgi:uncharacterized membrane protein YeaQ/YmgE (transglycosylase-associated protein family)
MNLVLGIAVGALVGWTAFHLLRLNTHQGLFISLAIGVFGGGMGIQFAPILSEFPIPQGQVDLFGLVVAAVAAAALLVILSMISSPRGG